MTTTSINIKALSDEFCNNSSNTELLLKSLNKISQY